eukprot:g6237.t1
MSHNALWFSVFALIVIFAQGQTTLSVLSGVWQSNFPGRTVNFFTNEGQGVVCRDALSPECQEEITPLEETYIFNGTSWTFTLRNRVGVTTRFNSALRHPSCARDSIFPAERTFDIPETRNLSYDSDAERLYFVDPRLPNIVSCVPMRLRVGAHTPFLEAIHIVSFQRLANSQSAPIASFSCDPLPQDCRVDLSDNGDLEVAAQVPVNLTCIAGDCLTAFEASVPLASHTLIESEDDV